MNTITIKDRAKELTTHIDSLPRVYNQQFGYVAQLDIDTAISLNYRPIIDVFELYFKLDLDGSRNDIEFYIVKKKFRGRNNFRRGMLRKVKTTGRDLVKLCKLKMDEIDGIRAGCYKTPNEPEFPMKLIAEWCEVLEEEWSK